MGVIVIITEIISSKGHFDSVFGNSVLVRELSGIISETKPKEHFLVSFLFLFLHFLGNQTEDKREREYLHEEIERQPEGLELGGEAPDGSEGAEIESHDDDLGAGKLGEDSSLGVLGGFEASSREDQLGPALG